MTIRSISAALVTLAIVVAGCSGGQDSVTEPPVSVPELTTTSSTIPSTTTTTLAPTTTTTTTLPLPSVVPYEGGLEAYLTALTAHGPENAATAAKVSWAPTLRFPDSLEFVDTDESQAWQEALQSVIDLGVLQDTALYEVKLHPASYTQIEYMTFLMAQPSNIAVELDWAIRYEVDEYDAELEGTFNVSGVEVVMMRDEYGSTAFYLQGPHLVTIYSLAPEEVLEVAQAMILANLPPSVVAYPGGADAYLEDLRSTAEDATETTVAEVAWFELPDGSFRFLTSDSARSFHHVLQGFFDDGRLQDAEILDIEFDDGSTGELQYMTWLFEDPAAMGEVVADSIAFRLDSWGRAAFLGTSGGRAVMDSPYEGYVIVYSLGPHVIRVSASTWDSLMDVMAAIDEANGR